MIVVNKLARNQGFLTLEIKAYVKRVIRYLNSIKDFKSYKSDDVDAFRSFVNASYFSDIVTNPKDRKSTLWKLDHLEY